MKIIKFCNKYIGKEKTKLHLYVIISILTSIFSLLITIITGNFVDLLVEGNNVLQVRKVCIYFAVISLLVVGLTLFRSYLYTLIQTKTAYIINREVIEHIKKLPRTEYFEMDSSYFNQRINNDSNSIVTFYIDVIIDVLTNIIVGIISMYIIYKINKKIYIILIFLCILYIIIYKFFKDKLYSYSYKYKEEQAEFFSKLNEQLEYIDFINLHSLNKYFTNSLQNVFTSFFMTIKKYSKISIMFTGSEQVISVIADIIIYIIMAVEIFSGNISIGMFTIVISYFGNSLQCIKYFLALGKNYQENLVAYNRLKVLLDKTVHQEGENVVDKIDNIEICGLNYFVDGRKILDNINIKMDRGKLYIIKGGNGVGKTTLIKILLGMYKNEYTGTIKINGMDIRTINMEEFRRNNVSITEQENILINDSILNNILLFNPEASEKDINTLINVLRLKPLMHINILENKLNISGGERQKIAIARTLLTDTEVMILDEPTSALDEVVKNDLVQFIKKYKKNKIIIIISHDMEFDNYADNIYYL